MLDEEARVWTGSEIRSIQQGIKVLGCPLGHVDFVRAQLFMLEALMEMESGSLVRMFYGNHSTYLWEDEAGVVHTVEQGEGGEQGDVLMPLLCSLGQHAASKVVQKGIA